MDEGKRSADNYQEQKEEVIKFIHPKYLPNTAFIKEKPKPVLDMFRDMLDRFNQRYDFTDDKIERQIRESKGVIKYIFNEEKNSLVSTVQAIIDDIHNYDRYYEDHVKKRLFRNNKPYNITEKFISSFDLFCARHHISRTAGSNWAFGGSSYIKMFERGDISLRIKTVDKVALEMYRIDTEHIKRMGDTYVNWKKYGQ